jgi:hypothetical protein
MLELNTASQFLNTDMLAICLREYAAVDPELLRTVRKWLARRSKGS